MIMLLLYLPKRMAPWRRRRRRLLIPRKRADFSHALELHCLFPLLSAPSRPPNPRNQTNKIATATATIRTRKRRRRRSNKNNIPNNLIRPNSKLELLLLGLMTHSIPMPFHSFLLLLNCVLITDLLLRRRTSPMSLILRMTIFIQQQPTKGNANRKTKRSFPLWSLLPNHTEMWSPDPPFPLTLHALLPHPHFHLPPWNPLLILSSFLILLLNTTKPKIIMTSLRIYLPLYTFSTLLPPLLLPIRTILLISPRLIHPHPPPPLTNRHTICLSRHVPFVKNIPSLINSMVPQEDCEMP